MSDIHKQLPSAKLTGTSVTKVGFNVRKDIASGNYGQDSDEYITKVIRQRSQTVVHGKRKVVENATFNSYLAFKLELADKMLPKIDKQSLAVKQSKRAKRVRRYSSKGMLLNEVKVK